jgi:hypothetical protein
LAAAAVVLVDVVEVVVVTAVNVVVVVTVVVVVSGGMTSSRWSTGRCEAVGCCIDEKVLPSELWFLSARV